MGRLILVIGMLAVSGIIYLIKAGASKVTGKETVDFQDESRKVMEKTAKGVNWMEDQWAKARVNASGNNNALSSGNISDLSATELIVRVKSDPVKYDLENAEGFYIEQAIVKINKRQFDDARKLVMQLTAGEARDFMLNEIEEKRNS